MNLLFERPQNRHRHQIWKERQLQSWAIDTVKVAFRNLIDGISLAESLDRVDIRWVD